MNELSIIDELLEIQCQFELLKAKNGYEPGEEMNTLWKKCLNLMQSVPINIEYRLTQTDRFRDLVSSICQLSMEAEVVEELHYSQQLQYSNSLSATHSHLEYFIHYKQVINLELNMIKIAMKVPINEIVFIGCGPLPMSSYELISQLPELKRILNIDHDQRAVQLAESFVHYNRSHFGDDKMAFLKIDARELKSENIKTAQIIYYGAMVGENSDTKNTILKHMHQIMLDRQILLVRTSRGLRQIFYPQVYARDLQEIGFKLQLETHLYMDSDIMTSVLIVMK
jgi:hypothetical protein